MKLKTTLLKTKQSPSYTW